MYNAKDGKLQIYEHKAGNYQCLLTYNQHPAEATEINI
jgi:hypothetical protein